MSMFRFQLSLMLMSRSQPSHTSTLSQLLPPSLMLPLQLLMLPLPLMLDTLLLPLTTVMPEPTLLLDTLVSLLPLDTDMLLLDMLSKQLPLQQASWNPDYKK